MAGARSRQVGVARVCEMHVGIGMAAHARATSTFKPWRSTGPGSEIGVAASDRRTLAGARPADPGRARRRAGRPPGIAESRPNTHSFGPSRNPRASQPSATRHGEAAYRASGPDPCSSAGATATPTPVPEDLEGSHPSRTAPPRVSKAPHPRGRRNGQGGRVLGHPARPQGRGQDAALGRHRRGRAVAPGSRGARDRPLRASNIIPVHDAAPRLPADPTT